MTRFLTIIAAIAVAAAAAFNPGPKAAAPVEAPKPGAGEAVAVFAGGCFWCVESDFEKLLGVKSAVSGYTGGSKENPTYREVSSETTGHLEAVQIVYDPSVVSYRALVDYFFRHIDPLDAGGQFCDRGESYTTAIFVSTPEERTDAEAARADAARALDADIVTAIRDASRFWVAEDYHQDYYKTNPIRYRYYRTSCGRDQRVKALWGAAKD